MDYEQNRASINGKTKPTETCVIRGFISAGGWDEEGRVDNLCLVTEQGKTFFLKAVELQTDLFAYFRKSVVVEGRPFSKDGLSWLSVIRIVKVPDPSD